MTLPLLRDAQAVVVWAGQLVAEIDRRFTQLANVQRRRELLQLAIYTPDKLPNPLEPGLVCMVRDGTLGLLMLQSSDANTWQRVDTGALYP